MVLHIPTSPDSAGPAASPADRRQAILLTLERALTAVTGTDLAHQFGVSRQIIVQDIAVLRAAGQDVLATPQGYTLAHHLHPAAHQRVIACRHGREQVADELFCLVDLGVTVIDVIVEHPLYGEIRAPLWLRSRVDVERFVLELDRTGASLLSSLTQGVHLHTLEADSEARLQAAVVALEARGYLLAAD